MIITNFIYRYMAVHVAADMAKALKTPCPETPFQVGESQLIAIRGLAKTNYAQIQIPNRDTIPTPPSLLIMKKF